jgi:plastocyanin
VAAVGLSPLLSACSSDDAEVTLVEGVSIEIIALDNSYTPEVVEVQAGTEVVFRNRGRNDHDVIPVDEAQDALTVVLADLPPGASETRRLVEPGTYDYYCSIHGTTAAGMIGTVIVTEGGP